jgi:hypothetical protein
VRGSGPTPEIGPEALGFPRTPGAVWAQPALFFFPRTHHQSPHRLLVILTVLNRRRSATFFAPSAEVPGGYPEPKPIPHAATVANGAARLASKTPPGFLQIRRNFSPFGRWHPTTIGPHFRPRCCWPRRSIGVGIIPVFRKGHGLPGPGPGARPGNALPVWNRFFILDESESAPKLSCDKSVAVPRSREGEGRSVASGPAGGRWAMGDGRSPGVVVVPASGGRLGRVARRRKKHPPGRPKGEPFRRPGRVVECHRGPEAQRSSRVLITPWKWVRLPPGPLLASTARFAPPAATIRRCEMGELQLIP